MRNDWILDVLTDLQSFAEQNGLTASAEQLSDACVVVASELSHAEPQAVLTQVGANDVQIAGLSRGHTAR